MNDALLIFPAGQPGADAARARAEAQGRRVIGASSLDYDPVRSSYDVWEKLPFFGDPNFLPLLGAAIERHGVGAVHAPHYAVLQHLSEHLPEIAPGVTLTGEETIQQGEKTYRELRLRLAHAEDVPFDSALPPRPALRPAERAGLIRLANTIGGMSSEEKMLAVIDMMRCAPRGDIVEIGCWWGRSAALLVLLAHRFDLGPVLCVDPWSSENVVQGYEVLDKASAAADMDEALRIFEINLAPLALGRLNYLRMPAAEGARAHGPGLTLDTAAFGATTYSGEIGVLHIDGNHTFEHADEDVRLWTPKVRPGGWIIVDDYFWIFGDGPKRAGDAFIERERDRIQLSFVAGKALFIQLKA